jgi:hypothetical protein
MLSTVWALVADNAGGVLLRVVGVVVVAVVVGVVAAVGAIVVSRRMRFLPSPTWLRRTIFVAWALAVPALCAAGGVFVGAGKAAAYVVEHNHLTEKIASAAVHGVVDVAFAHDDARALLDHGLLPITQTTTLFEVLPRTLGQSAMAQIDVAIDARTGGGLVAALAKRFAHLGVHAVVASSSLARAEWAAPVLKAMRATDADHDDKASPTELGAAIVRVHAEPKVAHLVDDVVAGQGAPFFVIALAVLVLPALIERLVAFIRRRQAAAGT